MTHWPDGDSERARRLVKALNEDLERHWGVPAGVLSQASIAHIASDSNRATWTCDGGVVACVDADLVANIAATITRHSGHDYAELLSELQTTLGSPTRAAASYLDVSLYCVSPTVVKTGSHERVEMLSPAAEGLPPIPPRAEHVFVIREETMVVSHACNVPNMSVGDIRLHAVGAGTHPDHRRRGLGRAVVSALVEHIISEGDMALWNCDGLNIPSVRLARAVGFVEFLWHFKWGVSEEEMQYRRGAISRTG